MPFLKGVAAAPGIVAGRAVIRRDAPDGRRTHVPHDDAERLAQAVARTRDQLEELARRVAGGDILRTQAFMLDDALLMDAVERHIHEGLTAEDAVERAVSALAAQFAKLADARLRERAADVGDLGRRLIRNLEGDAEPAAPAAGILFAASLTPSEVSLLDPSAIPAIVTEYGASTGHAAILARSLHIAAVMGVEGALAQVKEGDWVVVDGTRGEVTIGADESAHVPVGSAEIEELPADLPAVTLDGSRIELAANIAGLQDVPKALAAGAESVGVLRTEFLFLNRDQAPTEDEQFEQYRQIVCGMAPRRVTIRMIDAGGDKELPYLRLPPEENPALGLRGVRLCLERPDFFCTQLRAILRAAAHGNAAVLLPMVCDVCEVRRTRGLLERPIALGVMIETPAAALMAPELAQEADFFSIGTNDLIQYVLAVDRLNERLASLYQPFHPAVLRMVRSVCQAAEEHGKGVAVCGEMAADPLAAPLLIGLGVGELSMNPSSIPGVKAAVRRFRRSDAQLLAAEALRCRTASEVMDRVREFGS